MHSFARQIRLRTNLNFGRNFRLTVGVEKLINSDPFANAKLTPLAGGLPLHVLVNGKNQAAHGLLRV
ncbi:MAG: hypothetical protein IPJ38_19305 [Dechloromonas sp.]|uniref:Uncharacterized protein n=1 Tax=Candidatus Dechloromonas phosphorivorans TaxID=2899244 RepID=A0A935JZY7_9RHOO|nr:hypothetical protein [Candidatus Dechloromonas phosphorivorans]